eukprot:6491397-Amphidinium_carterae.2
MAMGFLMKSVLADFGIAVGTLVRGSVQDGVEVFFSNSSAARAFAQRKGLGRQKHVHVQDKVLAKEATVESVNTAVNVADALTKPVASSTMDRHLRSMGFDFRQSWSALHRRSKPAKVTETPNSQVRLGVSERPKAAMPQVRQSTGK